MEMMTWMATIIMTMTDHSDSSDDNGRLQLTMITDDTGDNGSA